MGNSGKFYITTPIYYVNARPHIGHAYTTLVCDAVARYHRMCGDDVYFLTGTDEHGVNVERSAVKQGKAPLAWSDEVSKTFRDLFDKMGISYNDFIRTTEDRHKRGVQKLWRQLRDNGYIYKANFTGQYCPNDNLYVDAAGAGEPCPLCGRPTETVSEENYFFKLSAFGDKLLELYEKQPDFITPESRRNEVASFVKSGLRDLSISRSTFKWGVPVPDDPDHVVYVWLDALSNYITALGYGSDDPKDIERFNKFWPADVHMMGKEIVRFHAVYWPAFLMAAGIPLPKQIITHGWLLFEENKMSKSRGNVVRANTIIDTLGNDALRYFLLREIVFGQDGSFSFDALVQRYDSDLANGLGNLASRTLTMINNYCKGTIPPFDLQHIPSVDSTTNALIRRVRERFEDYDFYSSLSLTWELISMADGEITRSKPWQLVKEPASKSKLDSVLYFAAECLRITAVLAHPILPDSTRKIWSQLGLTEIEKVNPLTLQWGGLKPGTLIGETSAVFPRAEKGTAERMQQMEELMNKPVDEPAKSAETPKATTPAIVTSASGTVVPSATPAEIAKITIDDFTKVELRVGLVKVAEKVKGADKLLRLEVDIGTEVRQVLAGIALAYEPEKLIGRKVVIVANLAPRKLRGLESNGMIVAASLDDGAPVLAGFLEDVPVGARLK